MDGFIKLVASFWRDIFSLLNNTVLTYGSVDVSLGSMIFVPLVIGLVVTIFWKGSRT